VALHCARRWLKNSFATHSPLEMCCCSMLQKDMEGVAIRRGVPLRAVVAEFKAEKSGKGFRARKISPAQCVLVRRTQLHYHRHHVGGRWRCKAPRWIVFGECRGAAQGLDRSRPILTERGRVQSLIRSPSGERGPGRLCSSRREITGRKEYERHASLDD